ncbi:TPA: hypothetical protein JZ208_002244 [Staphylococcus aureus]|uniref:DUF6978 family protein n=1 Tax=Staphylococcus aureus TaxID=1280 RepID=UPI001964B0F1|nr:hypothetical protein [Staphylococcus aureus]MBM9749162.1 hypothetical protein [Staphylococcus aureus]HAY0800830.1 hypothetical protein [Staphylococcus aureus]HAY1559025.1 hypothetical protein [Staphylococcus aureus]HAY1824988.1 hypothetical protein [Staphylococcus aureus]HAY2870940.1 hypothetical protein [Staphylococcus aureus]
MHLKLNDEDLNYLVNISKEILEQYNIKLDETCKGDINITSCNSEYFFTLIYFLKPGKATINFRECRYNYSLLRLNLNDGFHKNSNNEKIRGNRINIFSENEFIQKADGATHMKAYPLPYNIFDDSSDFVKQLFTLLEYTKTNHNDNIKIETNLFMSW